MPFLICLLLFSEFGPGNWISSTMTLIEGELHSRCLVTIPSETHYPQILQSLICGRPLVRSETPEFLLGFSLLSLVSASGILLSWWDQRFNYLGCSGFLRRCLILLFVLTWLAPAVLWRWLIARWLSDLLLPWTPPARADQRILWGGALTIALMPDSISSRGLILAWAAALAWSLSWGKTWRKALRGLAILWLLWIPILGIAIQIPWGFLLHVPVYPLFVFGLWPLAVTAWIFPLSVGAFDRAFAAFERVVGLLPVPDPAPLNHMNLPAAWAWLLAIHLAAHLILTRRARARG